LLYNIPLIEAKDDELARVNAQMQGKPISGVTTLEEKNKSGADIAQLKSTFTISLTALEEKTDALNEQQQKALSMH